MSTLRIGAIDIAVVSDGRLRLDPGLMFKPDDTSEFRQRVELEEGRLPFSVNCVLLRVGDRRILLDTGAGRDTPMLMERYGGGCGLLVDNLRALGVQPADIDTVVISHAHGDHIGGATIPAGDEMVPTFPEALYWLWDEEWSYWTKPEVLEVAPGVRLIPAPGHTPGHLCVAIVSGQEMALYTGDLLHHQCQLEHPEWSDMFDLMPEVSAASRRRILEDAHHERAVLLTAHLPTPGIVHPTAQGYA